MKYNMERPCCLGVGFWGSGFCYALIDGTVLQTRNICVPLLISLILTHQDDTCYGIRI